MDSTKIIAIILVAALVVTLTLSAARVLGWFWFYAVAILAALYSWYLRSRQK